MKRKYPGAAILATAALLLSGCGESNDASQLVLPENSETNSSSSIESSCSANEDSKESSNSQLLSSSNEPENSSSSQKQSSSSTEETSSSSSVNLSSLSPIIKYNASGATVQDNNGCVETEESLVTISCGGTYEFSGSNGNGQIRVNTLDNDSIVRIRLNNLDLTNLTDAPLFVINSSRTIVKALDQTTNIFTDSKTRTAVKYTKKGKTSVKEDTTSACLYAKGDLTINGTGTIVVNGNFKNGIQASDDIRIRDTPTINVIALNNALKGKGSVDIEGGTLSLTAKKGSGIKSDEGEDESVLVEEKGSVFIKGGDITIQAEDEGIFAYNEIYISDEKSQPELNITSKTQGLRASFINMGNALSTTFAHKDGWSATEKINVTAGYHYINASSDGLDAGIGITMDEGTVIVENLGVKENAHIVTSEKYTLFKGGFFLGFGSRTKNGVAQTKAFSENSYYGTSKGVFKPSFKGTVIVLGTDSEIIEEDDVSNYSSICFPKNSDNCFYYKD